MTGLGPGPRNHTANAEKSLAWGLPVLLLDKSSCFWTEQLQYRNYQIFFQRTEVVVVQQPGVVIHQQAGPAPVQWSRPHLSDFDYRACQLFFSFPAHWSRRRPAARSCDPPTASRCAASISHDRQAVKLSDMPRFGELLSFPDWRHLRVDSVLIRRNLLFLVLAVYLVY